MLNALFRPRPRLHRAIRNKGTLANTIKQEFYYNCFSNPSFINDNNEKVDYEDIPYFYLCYDLEIGWTLGYHSQPLLEPVASYTIREISILPDEIIFDKSNQMPRVGLHYKLENLLLDKFLTLTHRLDLFLNEEVSERAFESLLNKPKTGVLLWN